MKQIVMFSIWQNKMHPIRDSNQTCEVWFKDISESVSMSYAALKPLIGQYKVELVMQEEMNGDVLFTYKVNENR